LETAANLLELLERVLSFFSKRALKSSNDQADFDSAIRRFDPSRPSQLILLALSPRWLLHFEMRDSAARYEMSLIRSPHVRRLQVTWPSAANVMGILSIILGSISLYQAIGEARLR
jgi:hypothetical protein